jgi:hypothetical protein
MIGTNGQDLAKMNNKAKYRTRVIDWRGAMISTQVSAEMGEMNKRRQALKDQEAYR